MTDLKLADQIDDMINPLVERRQRTLPTAARIRFETIYNEIRDRICLLRYPPGHTPMAPTYLVWLDNNRHLER